MLPTDRDLLFQRSCRLLSFVTELIPRIGRGLLEIGKATLDMEPGNDQVHRQLRTFGNLGAFCRHEIISQRLTMKALPGLPWNCTILSWQS